MTPRPAFVLVAGLLLVTSCTDDEHPPTTDAEPLITCTYFVATTGSDGGAGTEMSPWATLAHAISEVEAGEVICLQPGTYNQRTVIDKSGDATSGNIHITKAPGAMGTVTLGGSIAQSGIGCPSTIHILGQSYIEISNIDIINGGNSLHTTNGFCGVGLMIGDEPDDGDMDLFPTPSTNVYVHEVNFHDIEPVYSTQYSIPLNCYSYSAGDGAHDVIISGNSFVDNDTGNGVITGGQIAIGGNVLDFEVSNNYFSDADSVGIDTAGNVNDTNIHPTRGHFHGNFFDGVGSADLDPVAGGIQATYAIYFQATEDMLVDANFFKGCGYGVGVMTEPTMVSSPWLASKTWIRDNLFLDTVITDVAAGVPNGSGYLGVEDVYVTNNTIYRMSSWSYTYPFFVPSNGTAYLTGDSAFLNNIVFTDGEIAYIMQPMASTLVIDYNLYGSAGGNRFVLNNTAMSFSGFRSASPHDDHSDLVTPSSSYFFESTEEIWGFQLAAADNGGTFDRVPSWVPEFGDAETDIYGGDRVTPNYGYEGWVIGRGADQFCVGFWFCEPESLSPI